LSTGRHGRGAVESRNACSTGNADRLRRVHNLARSRAYVGADDIHLYTAEYRSRLQSA